MVYDEKVKRIFKKELKNLTEAEIKKLEYCTTFSSIKENSYLLMYPIQAFRLAKKYPNIFYNLSGEIADKYIFVLLNGANEGLNLLDKMDKWSYNEMKTYVNIKHKYGIDVSNYINLHVYKQSQIEVLIQVEDDKVFDIIKNPYFKAIDMKRIMSLLDQGFDYLDYSICSTTYISSFYKFIDRLKYFEGEYTFNFDDIKYIMVEKNKRVKDYYPSEKYILTCLRAKKIFNIPFSKIIDMENYQITNYLHLKDIYISYSGKLLEDKLYQYIGEVVGGRLKTKSHLILNSVIKSTNAEQWYAENSELFKDVLILDIIQENIKVQFPLYEEFNIITKLIDKLKIYSDYCVDCRYFEVEDRRTEKKLSAKEKRKKELPAAIEMIRRFVDYKYTSTTSYMRECGIEEKDFKRALKTLEMFENPILSEYKELGKANQKKHFAMIKNSINKVIDSIESNPKYSLYDYCMDCKTPIDRAYAVIQSVSNENISYDRKQKFYKFYKRNMSKLIYISNDSIYNSSWIIRGYEVTKLDKKAIVRYMMENKIPFYVSVYKEVGRRLLKDKIDCYAEIASSSEED